MPRYFMRITHDGVEIYDSTTGDANDAEVAIGPNGMPLDGLSWDGASRLLYIMNRAEHEKNNFSFLSHAPLTPCPDCVRYRAALNAARCEPDAERIRFIIDDALDAPGGG
jgi:hypothetical protein